MVFYIFGMDIMNNLTSNKVRVRTHRDEVQESVAARFLLFMRVCLLLCAVAGPRDQSPLHTICTTSVERSAAAARGSSPLFVHVCV